MLSPFTKVPVKPLYEQRYRRFSILKRYRRFSILKRYRRFSILKRYRRFSIFKRYRRFSILKRYRRFSILKRYRRFSILKRNEFCQFYSLMLYAVTPQVNFVEKPQLKNMNFLKV